MLAMHGTLVVVTALGDEDGDGVDDGDDGG